MLLLEDTLLVKLIEEEKKESGIFCPVNTNEKQYRKAKIIKLGMGNKTILEVDDVLYISKFCGVDVTINEIDYIVMTPKDIIVILEGEEI